MPLPNIPKDISRIEEETFCDCNSLESIVIPDGVTTIGRSAFRNCTSLTTAPELPATALAALCYCNMFRGCTGLTNAPALPATTLAKRCYEYMFYGCSNLTELNISNFNTLKVTNN